MIDAPCFLAASITSPSKATTLMRLASSPNSCVAAVSISLTRSSKSKQRLLARMDADRRIDDVGDRQRSLQHVEMAVGQRVEGAGIDGDAVGHGKCF